MRKPAVCISENKGADQLHVKRAADQCLYFRYLDSTIPLLLKSTIQSLYLNSYMAIQSGVCVRPGQKPRRQVFLMTRLK